MTVINLHCLTAIGLACLALANAALATPVAKPPRTVRILAVGENPPFRQEIRDGVAYELAPPPDSLPPFDVATRPLLKPGDAEPAVAAEGSGLPLAHSSLRLGRISAPLVIPPGAGLLEILKFENGVSGDPWLKLKRPESGDILVVLWRAPGQETWKTPSAILLPDGPDVFPAGTIRIVNLFPQAVRIAFAGENLTLATLKTQLKPVKTSVDADAAVFQIIVRDANGAPGRYFSGAVTQQPGERGIIIIHRADGIKPRRPLLVTNLREPMPAPEPASKAANGLR